MTSNTLEFTVGIDLAQDTFDAAIAPQGSDVMAWRDLPHAHFDAPADSIEGAAALEAWLAQVAPEGRCLRVVVESTGACSRRAARQLSQRGLGVAIINPYRSHAFGLSLGVRDKTDRIECAILSVYGMIRKPALTAPPNPRHEQMRELSRLRQVVVEEQTAWKSRRTQAGSDGARQIIENKLNHLDQEIEALDAQIESAIATDAVLSRQVRDLKQIKGIGPVTAQTLTAELGDLRAYSRSQLVAVAGLFPKVHDSGKSVHRRPRLAKGGGGRLRRVLYMGATSLFYSKGPMRVWIEGQIQKGYAKMVVEAMVMRKLLLVARAVMLCDGHYEPAKIGWEEA